MIFKKGFIALASGVVFAGASSLISTTAFAGEISCNEAQEDVWDYFQDRLDFAEQVRAAYATNATEKDCEKICKDVSKSCRKVLDTEGGANKHEVKADLKVGKRLCGTVADKGERDVCKGDLKALATEEKDGAKSRRDDVKDACRDDNMMQSCMDSCGGSLPPSSCEDSFFDILIQ